MTNVKKAVAKGDEAFFHGKPLSQFRREYEAMRYFIQNVNMWEEDAHLYTDLLKKVCEDA